jgi:hypothetical protein
MPTAIQISRDEAVLVGNAARWRTAMERSGKTAVEAYLQRPGRPTDRVLDIGYEPPYPTREFCQEWCTEQDNILFRFSPRIALVLTLSLILLVCVLNAVSDLGVPPIRPGSIAGATPMASTSPPGVRAAPSEIQGVPAYQPVTVPQSMPLPVPWAQQTQRTAGAQSP